MKEPHEKGVAIHSAPSFAGNAAKYSLKRKQGYRRVGYRASKSCDRGADAVICSGRQYGLERLTRASGQPCVVKDPKHVWKLHTREPGDLGDACA